jgi:hypothetical protein
LEVAAGHYQSLLPADGSGSSLQIVDEAAAWTSWSEMGQWQPSNQAGGSAGANSFAVWQTKSFTAQERSDESRR